MPTSAWIHETAKVHPTAKLGHGCVIGRNVVIGERAVVGAYSVLGGMPESLGFYDDVEQNRTCGVRVGEGARIFEFVTVHAGTQHSTVIAAGASVFNHSHVAHDCIVDTNAIVGGHTSLAGHVHVMRNAIISGKSAIHQWCVIGPYGFLAGNSFLKAHLPPGEKWIGSPARPAGANEVGLARAAFLSLEHCALTYMEEFLFFTRRSKLT